MMAALSNARLKRRAPQFGRYSVRPTHTLLHDELTMGLFWDLLQQSQIDEQSERAKTLDGRVALLEAQVRGMNTLLRTVIERLEQHLRVDLDKDGKVR